MLKQNQKILALDFGLKRIGVAVGDTQARIAFPRDAIQNDQHVFKKIADIVSADHIEKILIGNPLKRDGSKGDIDDMLRQFVKNLRKTCDMPIELVDERYTSKIASEKLARARISAKDGKKLQDSVAAQVMLQECLH